MSARRSNSIADGDALKIAVIPARGGSKRISRKNIREFCGKPMIAYSIECAHRSGIFDRIIVSTDDDEIAQVAIRFGAEVPFMRPKELADDYAGTVAVIAHATAWLQSAEVNVSSVCCIYATTPFICADDVCSGLRILEAGKWLYVFSATNFAAPVFRSFLKSKTEGVQMLFPEHFSTRSQDLPETFHDAAQFYWGRPEAWLSGAPIFGELSAMIPLPRWRVQDIDTEEDWVRAELMAGVLKNPSGIL